MGGGIQMILKTAFAAALIFLSTGAFAQVTQLTGSPLCYNDALFDNGVTFSPTCNSIAQALSLSSNSTVEFQGHCELDPAVCGEGIKLTITVIPIPQGN